MFYHSRERSRSSAGQLYGNYPEDSFELLGKGTGYEIEDITHEILKARETLIDKSDAIGNGVLLLIHPYFKPLEEDEDFYNFHRYTGEFGIGRFFKMDDSSFGNYKLNLMLNNAKEMKYPVFVLSASFRYAYSFSALSRIVPRQIEDREHNRSIDECTPEKIREEIQLIFQLALEDLKLIDNNINNNNNNNNNEGANGDNNKDSNKSHKCSLM